MEDTLTHVPDHLLQVLSRQYTDGIGVLSATGDITYISHAVTKILGYTPAEALKLNVFNITHPEDVPQLAAAMHELVANPGSILKSYIIRLLHKNGSWCWLQTNATNMLHDPAIGGIVGNFRDITVQKDNELKLTIANRLYNLHSQVNQAIVHTKDINVLFEQVCRICTETGKFKFAWIGELEENDQKVWMVAQSGASAADVELFKDMRYSKGGPVSQLLEGNDVWIVNDFSREPIDSSWSRYAFPRGFQSAIALPLKRSGKTTYILNLYVSRPGFFTCDEAKVLQAAAADISFAIDAYEQEIQRRKAEEKLRQSELRLNHAQAIAHLGSWEFDNASQKAIWSQELCNIYGVPFSENMHGYESWLSFIHPEDRDYVLRIMEEQAPRMRNFSFEYRIVRGDGTIRHLLSHNYFELTRENQPVLLYGATLDITSAKEAEEKLVNANRLYSFISQVNQAIVHKSDECSVFREVCRIAIETGKFKMAWISRLDLDNHELNMIEQCGLPAEDHELLIKNKYIIGGISDTAITSDCYGVCNDIYHEDVPEKWRDYLIERGVNSCLVLPVKKNGTIYGTFSLCSGEPNFFTEQEISLMLEATNDMSFALDVFSKEQLRIEADKKMHESISRYNQAQKIAHLGSWHVNFDTGEAIWSDETLNIYGLPASASLQSYESWLSFIHPDDVDRVLSIVSRSQRELQSSSYYHRIIRPDGTIRHLHSQAHFEFIDGRPVGLYGMAHDITEVIEVKEALRQAQENLSIVVDLVPQPIFAQDIAGNYVFVNRSFASIYGLRPADMIGRNISEVISANNDARKLVADNMQIIENNRVAVIPELPFTDHAGSKRIFHVTKVPYTLPGRSEKAILGIALDITERKQADQERNKIIADLLQRNKDLEQFSYIVSHNLRAPVANIIGLTTLMKELANDPDEQEIIVEGLISSGRKLDSVIKDLNKTLQVKHEVNEYKETVQFSSLLADIEHSISNLLHHEDALIVSDFTEAKEMPALKSYMYSIFFNLISNSIKYRKPGKRPVIEIRSSIREGRTVLTFKDNGMGIDMERKGHEVFGLYKRFHHHIDGKGMGLFMVKAQVERLNGRIVAESEVNKGTTFTIEFE